MTGNYFTIHMLDLLVLCGREVNIHIYVFMQILDTRDQPKKLAMSENYFTI